MLELQINIFDPVWTNVTVSTFKRIHKLIYFYHVLFTQETPPPYIVEDMQVPTAFFSGDSDILATPTDVRQLIPKIQNLVYNKEIPTYGHLDFTWAIDAADFVYSDIVKLMSKTGRH